MEISYDKNIVRNAVGRPAQLGDLYDARTDSFVGFSLLNEPIPDNATEVIKTPALDFNCVDTENILEKFEKLNIVPEMRASILANLVSLEGHAKYLQTEPKNKKARKSIFYLIKTEAERMIFTDRLNRHFALHALDLDFVTHFVVGILYGTNCIITLEENDYSAGEKRKKVNNYMKQEIRKFEDSIYEPNDTILSQCETWYSVEMFCDILPTNNLPMTGEEALKLLMKIPHLVKMANRGKGKPITYVLMPISVLGDHLNGTSMKEAFMPLDPNSVFNFTKSMSELMETKLEVSDLLYKLETHSYSVPVENIRKLSQLKSQIEKDEMKSRLKFKETIIAVRSRVEGVEMPMNCEFPPEDVKIQLKEFDNFLRKIELADELKSFGVTYIGSEESEGLDDKNIVRNAVGRLAQLGDLYDARTDSFVGFSVLNEPIPDNAKEVIKTPASDFNCIDTENILEKFEKVNIVPELRASIVANLVSLEGHAKYLQTEPKNKKARKSIIYSIQTEVEKMIFTDELNRHFTLHALDQDVATHFVVGITYGANSIITLEENDYSGIENRNKVNDGLKQELRKFEEGIHELKDSTSSQCETWYSVEMFGDILPTTNLPKTGEEALKILMKLPSLIKATNHGKGKPITYALMPISVLGDHLNGTSMKETVSPLDQNSVLNLTNSMSKLMETKLEISDLMLKLEAHLYCVPDNSLRKLQQLKSKVKKEEVKSKLKLKKTIIALRSGKESTETWTDYEFLPNKVKIQLKQFDNLSLKIELIDELKSRGVVYIRLEESQGFDEIKRLSPEVFILFLQSDFEQVNTRSWDENKSYFLNMVDQPRAANLETSFVAIDLDARSDSKINKKNVNIHIVEILNGNVVDFDVYATSLREISTCFAKTLAPYEDRPKPWKRTELVLQCPGSFKGACANDTNKWCCDKCKEALYFGFDGFFYCSCGGAPCKKYSYRCTDDRHGPDFIPFDRPVLGKLLSEISPLKELNVLILGVTGVGKSTWINAFLNYLAFPSLDTASKGKLLSVTSTLFQLTDEDDKTHTIRFGHDENEVPESGQSATQDVKAHLFSIGDTLLRLIDTPGIGDVRGVEQDKKNFKKILKYLRSLKWLNGICILLKPNESRLNVLFEFCIKELLTHLHRSASKNVVFCYTHSRETFYKPGDTQQPLGELLWKNNIKLSLDKDTMYCMDNESFRFLCASNHGVEFRDSVKKSFCESWNISVEETNRLISHFQKLEPHIINDTISLNDARQNIVCLTKPIADISKNIQQNLAKIRNKREMLSSTEASVKDLMKMLFVDIIQLETEPLGHPRTVCGADSCVEYHPAADGTSSNVQYVQHCHPHCYLEDVPVDIVGDARLRGCAAMNGTLNCVVCGCSWDQHLHITYVQIPVVVQITVKDVQTIISGKRSEQQQIQDFISKLDEIREEQENEQKKIIEVSVMMGHYLSKNAMLAYNDVLGRYIDHLIEKEEQIVVGDGNDDVLERLKSMRSMYDEEVRSLKTAIETANTKELTFTEFQTHLNGLYKLKHNGTQLQRAIKMASLTGSGEMKKNYEQFHDVATTNTNKGFLMNTIRSVTNTFFNRGQNKPKM